MHSTGGMPAEPVSPTTSESTIAPTGLDTESSWRRLVALARDETLIPGVHERCDQWCMYCPITDRCLAFRCTGGEGGVWNPCDTSDECVDEGIVFLKKLADVEGRLAPPEIEAVMSRDRERLRKVFRLDDPLERIGRSYMTLAAAYLQSRADFPFQILWRDAGPTPLEVLIWYHTLAPARVFRAILCAAEASHGVTGRDHDARAAAKVALIGIDRSLTAVETMRAEDDDPRLSLLQADLHRLRAAVETRFPDARSFARRGLDPEDAQRPWVPRWLRRQLQRGWRQKAKARDSEESRASAQ